MNRLQKSQYSLGKRNQYLKNAHNTKNSFKKIIFAPHGDSNIDADDDAHDASNISGNDAGSTYFKTLSYSLRNRNPVPGDAAVYTASPDDAASPNSLIDSKLNHKTDPRSMIKLKKN